MFNDVGKYISKADGKRDKKRDLINKFDTQANKLDNKACNIARKKYNNIYLNVLKESVDKNARDYEKHELERLIIAVNKKDIDIEITRKINDLDVKYGNRINNSESILDKYINVRGGM